MKLYNLPNWLLLLLPARAFAGFGLLEHVMPPVLGIITNCVPFESRILFDGTLSCKVSYMSSSDPSLELVKFA